MKFGYLTISYKHHLQFPKAFLDNQLVVGLGDYVQAMGVLELYKKMGLPERDIIPVDFDELALYQGEDVILPLNLHMVESCATSFPPSPNILPVFFGFHIANHVYPHAFYEYVDYFKLFEPIGCRDMATSEALSGLGINAYTSGCLSFLLPKRTEEPDPGKVFIADLGPAQEPLLPETIRKGAIRYAHRLPHPELPLSEPAMRRFEEMTRTRLSQYRKEASLVISSRMHVVSPCAAMGIPVVFMPEDPAEPRLGWIKSVVPAFSTPEEIAGLSWSPPAPPLWIPRTLRGA